jgi:hypothetical protein
MKGSVDVLAKETFMSQNDPGSWFFLLFNLPAKNSSNRVKEICGLWNKTRPQPVL